VILLRIVLVRPPGCSKIAAHFRVLAVARSLDLNLWSLDWICEPCPTGDAEAWSQGCF
jgi:hypothetical protein